jgi:hypothetical protein
MMRDQGTLEYARGRERRSERQLAAGIGLVALGSVAALGSLVGPIWEHTADVVVAGWATALAGGILIGVSDSTKQSA